MSWLRSALLTTLCGLGCACGVVTGIDDLTVVSAPSSTSPSKDASVDSAPSDAATRFCQEAAQAGALACDDFDDGAPLSSAWDVSACSGMAITASPSAVSPPNDLVVSLAANTTTSCLISQTFTTLPTTSLQVAFNLDVAQSSTDTTVLATLEFADDLALALVLTGTTMSLQEIASTDDVVGTYAITADLASPPYPRITIDVSTGGAPFVQITVNESTALQTSLKATSIATGAWSVALGLFYEGANDSQITVHFDDVVVTGKP